MKIHNTKFGMRTELLIEQIGQICFLFYFGVMKIITSLMGVCK